jgi:peptidoglycan-associated lipoprotein
LEVSSPGFYPTEVKVDLRGNIGEKKEDFLAIKLLPIKKEVVVVPPKIESKIRFIIKDKGTGQILDDANLTYFTEENRDGVPVGYSEGEFLMPLIPDSDFEIHARAKDYKEETITYKKGDIPALFDSVNTIYLSHLDSMNEIYKYTIYFNNDERKVTKEDLVKLDNVANYMIKNPEELIEIGGHTDSVASKEYNLQLSLERANAVFTYLREKGVPAEQMKIKAYFYSQPIGDNATEQGRALNRRVNFKRLN